MKVQTRPKYLTDQARKNAIIILDKLSVICSDEDLFDLLLDNNGDRLPAEDILPLAKQYPEIKFKFGCTVVLNETVQKFSDRLEQ